MSDATGVTSYVYDAHDRLVSKATPEGTLSYTYDAAGNRTTVRSDSGAYAVDYGYDALNRLSTVTDKHPDALAATAGAGQVTAYHYDLAGRLHDNVYPNGVATTWSYDDLGRITNITTAHGASALASYTYGLGPTGNRHSVAELNGRSVTWDYDGLYRLTTETIAGAASANGVIGYAYNPVGNRLSRTSTVPGIAAQAFTYDADDRLQGDAWDANGNTLASATSTYGYDSENRLVSLNASEAGYLYDGDGQLVRRTVGGVATTYLVDELTPAGYTQIAEERVGGVVAKSYVFGAQRISIRGAQGVHGYLYDAHSGVRALLDADGVATDTYEYDAFGSVVARTGTTDNAFAYRGEQMDPTLGGQYLRARWMRPANGTFWTADPLLGDERTPPTLVRRIYAGSNPVTYGDPGGASFTLLDLTFAAGIAGSLSAGAYIAHNGGSETEVVLGGLAAGGAVAAAVYFAPAALMAGTQALLAAGTAPRPLVATGSTWFRQLIALQGFNTAEQEIIDEAATIARSASFQQIVQAYREGASVAINVVGPRGARLITTSFERGYSFSGFTDRANNGFTLGGEAFASEAELAKTILHELYRLNVRIVQDAVAQAANTEETRRAAAFAERAYSALLQLL